MRFSIMRKHAAILLLLVVAIFTLSACKVETVGDPKRPIVIEAHIILDIRGLERTAVGIEDTVAEGVDENLPSPSSLRPINPLGPSEAHAETTYDIRYYTPTIERALNNRRARYRDLAVYKAQGFIGEGKNGYVVKLGGGPEVTRLVDAENNDRRIIYHAILEQNNLAPELMKTVGSVFAKIHRERSKPGEYIQEENGDWVKKS